MSGFTCERCGVPSGASIMSRFNTESLCTDCADEEMKAPGYVAAARRELEEVKGGNYNFPGVGLSAEDRAFLRNLRGQRHLAPRSAE